jgi:hypothetical protein
MYDVCWNASIAEIFSNRYESIQTVTNPTETQSGQFEGMRAWVFHIVPERANCSQTRTLLKVLQVLSLISKSRREERRLQRTLDMDRTSLNLVLEERRPTATALAIKVMSVAKKFMRAIDLIPGGFGGTSAQEGEGKPSQNRDEQGYGPGSGVGA